MRVLDWIVKRSRDEVDADKTAIGYIPSIDAINTNELDIEPAILENLLQVDTQAWSSELASINEHLDSFADRLPETIQDEAQKIADQLA